MFTNLTLLHWLHWNLRCKFYSVDLCYFDYIFLDIYLYRINSTHSTNVQESYYPFSFYLCKLRNFWNYNVKLFLSFPKWSFVYWLCCQTSVIRGKLCRVPISWPLFIPFPPLTPHGPWPASPTLQCSALHCTWTWHDLTWLMSIRGYISTPPPLTGQSV